ncbi:hypothetical protein BD311DRAFT_769936 [Dichomitus squalens]|uniref:Uncharacterized protein n=1 Tax=Dichomitus squalens TaxID=114155 RepID=A0A4Q9M8D3_9APHY|nr:hypothetical protein BD311DRAFT_769936 [Dichomitus squalens]
MRIHLRVSLHWHLHLPLLASHRFVHWHYVQVVVLVAVFYTHPVRAHATAAFLQRPYCPSKAMSIPLECGVNPGASMLASR